MKTTYIHTQKRRRPPKILPAAAQKMALAQRELAAKSRGNGVSFIHSFSWGIFNVCMYVSSLGGRAWST